MHPDDLATDGGAQSDDADSEPFETPLVRWGRPVAILTIFLGPAVLLAGVAGDAFGLPMLSAATATVAVGVLITLLGAGGLVMALLSLRSLPE